MSTTKYFLTQPTGSAIVGPFARDEVALYAEEGSVPTVASAPARHIDGRRSAAGLPTESCWFVTGVELRPSRADQYPLTITGVNVDPGRIPEPFSWRLPLAAVRSERYVFAPGVVDPQPALRLAEGVRAARQGRRNAVHARSCTEPTCGACPAPLAAQATCPAGPDAGGDFPGCGNSFDASPQLEAGDGWVECPTCGLQFALAGA